MGRREVLVDAALSVVAEAGLKGLTHRAVDARAALPSGSAANVFRDRRSLVRGVLDGLEERNRRIWSTMAWATPGTTWELSQVLVAAFVRIAVEPDAALTRVRLTMALAYPDEVRAGHQRLVALLETAMADCQVCDIDTRSPLMAALLDGYVFHLLTGATERPADSESLAAAVHALLVCPMGRAGPDADPA